MFDLFVLVVFFIFLIGIKLCIGVLWFLYVERILVNETHNLIPYVYGIKYEYTVFRSVVVGNLFFLIEPVCRVHYQTAGILSRLR